MSDRPSESSGVTPGDPLRPEGGKASVPEAPPPEPFGGYTSPPPPGAAGGRAAVVPPPAFASGARRLAGWWSRVAATLIDGLVIGAGAILITVAIGALFSAGFFASDEAGIASLIVGLALAFAACA